MSANTQTITYRLGHKQHSITVQRWLVDLLADAEGDSKSAIATVRRLAIAQRGSLQANPERTLSNIVQQRIVEYLLSRCRPGDLNRQPALNM